jgi:hypothetical protein
MIADPADIADVPRSPRPAADAGGTSLLLRAVLESLLLLLLMRAVEALFFGPGTFASMSLHPFWIVVLITSAQHGLFAGVITAGLAALMMEWPQRPIGMDITEHYLDVAIVPMQWLLVALCVGLFRQGEIRAKNFLAAENARLSEANEVLAKEVDRLDATIWDMELAAVTASAQAPAAALVPAEVPQADPGNATGKRKRAALFARPGRGMSASPGRDGSDD